MIKVGPDEGQRGNTICPQCKTKYRGVAYFSAAVDASMTGAATQRRQMHLADLILDL
jgi:hypothetical protein